MIIRSACLEGEVDEKDREAFDRQMRETVVDAIRTYPGIRDVRLRKLVQGEEGAPSIYMMFDLYFDSLDAMNEALASETRRLVRERIQEAMPSFKGRVFHLVFSEEPA
jgi:uncharacterized protein (TIGR02118 family)